MTNTDTSATTTEQPEQVYDNTCRQMLQLAGAINGRPRASRDNAIWAKFGAPAGYYARLSWIIDTPEAMREYPAIVHTLRRQRAQGRLGNVSRARALGFEV